MISFTFGANPRPAHRQLPPCQPSDLPERVLKMISFYLTRWESSFLEKAAVYLIVYLQGLSANIRQQSCNMFATFVS